MALDAQTIAPFTRQRDRVCLAIEALIAVADAEWHPLLKALLEAREWDHDDEIAASSFDEAGRACGVLERDCYARLEDAGVR